MHVFYLLTVIYLFEDLFLLIGRNQMLPFGLIIVVLLFILFERTETFETSYINDNTENSETDFTEALSKYLLKTSSERKLKVYNSEVMNLRIQKVIVEKILLEMTYERELKLQQAFDMQHRILKQVTLSDEQINKYWPTVIEEDSIHFDRLEDKYWIPAPISDNGAFITVQQIIYATVPEGTDIWYRVKYTCMSINKNSTESGTRIVLAKGEWLNWIRSDLNTVRYINGVSKLFWTVEEEAKPNLKYWVKDSLDKAFNDYICTRIRFIIDKERIQKERKTQPKKFPVKMFIRWHLDEIEYNIDYFTKHRYKNYQPVLFSNYNEHADRLIIELTELLKQNELRNAISNKDSEKYRKKII